MPRDAVVDVTHTVIFVDVDGILNVGTSDGTGGAPLLLTKPNIRSAMQQTQIHGAFADDYTGAERLLATVSHPLRGEMGTLGSLVACPKLHLCGVLVKRLAELIQAAGPRRTVVLSSSWRARKHWEHKARLEQELSNYLGMPFQFDDQTPDSHDRLPHTRMQCIGDYIADLAVPSEVSLRLLVLEDFFINPFNGWVCEGVRMCSKECAERYFSRRCQNPARAAVRLVHPYDEWTSGGLKMQASVGLTMEHYRNAMDFLCTAPDELSPRSSWTPRPEMVKFNSIGSWKSSQTQKTCLSFLFPSESSRSRATPRAESGDGGSLPSRGSHTAAKSMQFGKFLKKAWTP